MADFVLTEDRTDEVLREVDTRIEAALEACGLQAVSHVVNNLTKDAYKGGVSWYNRTGHLKDFSHQVSMGEGLVYVGTNTEYAAYWEFGTGEYSEKGGRQGYWVFVPGGGGGGVGSGKVYTEAEAKRIMAILQSKGVDAHMTKGIKPVHMLKNAIEENADEYIRIMMDQLNGS